MTSLTPSTNVAQSAVVRHRQDPVLTELWEIKAQMNAEADYDVKQLLENAHQAVQMMKATGMLVAREN